MISRAADNNCLLPNLQNLESLLSWNASSEQLNEISRLENGIRVPCFARSLDAHTALDKIELASYSKFLQFLGEKWPGFSQILLSILRK